MKYKDKISIIIPCYNVEKYVEKCIVSVIKQTYTNIEIIVIDDGSMDRTLEMLYKFAKIDKRIIVISKTNSGVSDTRNIGIERSTGNYIMFVDADDFLNTDSVELMYKKIKEQNADVVRGKYIKKDGKYNYIEKNIEKYNKSTKKEIITDIIKGKICCYVWLLIINKNFLNKNNIRFNENLKIMEDTLFYIQLLEKTDNIYFFDKVIYNYITNFNSATGNRKKTKKIYFEILRAQNFIKKELEAKGLLDKKIEKEIVKQYYINTIADYSWNLYKNGEYELFENFINSIFENKEIQETLRKYKVKNVRIDKYLIVSFMMNKNNKVIKKIYNKKLKFINGLKGKN